MQMKQIFKTLYAISAGLFISACNNASFDANPGTVFQQCAQGRPEVQCQVTCDDSGSCFSDYNYSVQAKAQQTDILFVVDNSASMHPEQIRMSTNFRSFMNSVRNIDYRIGVTTTDVTASPNNGPAFYNGNGAWQDGKLLQFDDNRPYLDGSQDAQTEQDLFDSNVRRDETLNCASRNFAPEHCPSGDERGIFASVLNLQNNPSQWIRPTGHMAIVILSDEDEGSDGVFIDPQGRDRPQGFVNHFNKLYPNKSLAVHSIIIRPGDNNCLSAQSAGKLGVFGNVYAQLTGITGGVLANICAPEYTSSLQDIGESASQFREVLPCQPYQNQVEVSFTPDVGNQVQVIRRLQQREILFNGNVPAGTQINLSFRCQQNATN